MSEAVPVRHQEIPVSCNKDCGGGCPLLAIVENGRITRIINSPHAGRYMNGCVRGFQAARTVYAPDRLLSPLVRTGPRGSGEFRAAGWDEALDHVAERLAEIKARYGPEAIMPLGGSGSCRGALHNTARLTSRFFALLGGYTATLSNYSSAAAGFVTPFVLGTQLAGVDVATLQHSRLIILWGANIADNRLGCETEAAVRAAKAQGTPVIVLDPRRSRTVRQLGTEWIPVQPGTDAALMMAVLYVWLQEGCVDTSFVAKYSVGFPELQQHLLGKDGTPPKTPAWAAAICGTPAEVITHFARRYGRTKPAALIPGLSVQRTVGGEEAIRMAIALQVASGNLGRLGGSSGALTWGRLPQPRCGALPVPRLANQPGVPVIHWPDAILDGRAGGYPTDIRGIYNVGGDYIVQGSDMQKSIRAFSRVGLAVCHDVFLTPTARYCDVVLPVTNFLERQDIVFPGANYLLFSNRAVPPPEGVRNDYDIFCALAERLGFGEAFSEGRDEEAWLQYFLDASEVPDHATFRRTGIYTAPEQARVGLADFVRDPAGNPLRTASGKIEIASVAYAAAGGTRIPQARVLPADAAYPLRLITPKSRYRTHSQNDNIPWFRAQEEQALWIHPADAAQRQIEDGQQVLVHNAQGRVRIAARVTDDIMPGVVCLLSGAWPRFAADGGHPSDVVEIAGSPNMLTPTIPTEPSQGSRTHSVLVDVIPTQPGDFSASGG